MFFAKPPKDKLSENYVDNVKFSQACYDYAVSLKEAKENGTDELRVPTYIAECFIKICNGASHQRNFKNYSYRSEMVSDAIENCLRAVKNYKIDASTRTGKPNAFGYFTQICTYAFLRRIAKEKKQAEIKRAVLNESQGDNMVHVDDNLKGTIAESVSVAYYDDLKRKMNEFAYDSSGELFHKSDKEETETDEKDESYESKTRKYIRRLDSDLEEYFQ